MIDQSTPAGRIVASALRLAGERPWADVTLRDIADAASVTLAELAREFSSKGAVLVAFNRMIDDEVLRNAPRPSPGQSARDAVFEVVMARFDALAPYRSAVRSIVADAAGDGQLVASLLKSQRWMLQAAGVDTDGVRGGVRVAGLASIYSGVFRTWLADDDPGLARTMAALDRRLRSGERTLTSVEQACSSMRSVKTMVRDMAGRLLRRAPADSGGAPAPETPVA